MTKRGYVDSILNPHGFIHEFHFYVDGVEIPNPLPLDTMRDIVSSRLGPREYLYLDRKTLRPNGSTLDVR